MSPVTPITPHPKRTAMAHHVVIKPVRNWIPIAVLIVLAPFLVWASVHWVSWIVRAVSAGAAAPESFYKDLKTAKSGSNVLKPALSTSKELPAEFTQEYQRVNGVRCPVYRRENGTFYVVVGEEKIDVEKVGGHKRRVEGEWVEVSGYYRSVGDKTAANNFSKDLHK